jgi:hypothetical protein
VPASQITFDPGISARSSGQKAIILLCTNRILNMDLRNSIERNEDTYRIDKSIFGNCATKESHVAAWEGVLRFSGTSLHVCVWDITLDLD